MMKGFMYLLGGLLVTLAVTAAAAIATLVGILAGTTGGGAMASGFVSGYFIFGPVGIIIKALRIAILSFFFELNAQKNKRLEYEGI